MGFGENISKLKNSDKATFQSPFEARVIPAPTSKRPEEREFVVDSGASMHMMSKKQLSSDELDTLRRSRNPTVVLTANGEVHTHKEAQVYVYDLDLFVTASTRGKASSPIILCVGQRSKTTVDQRGEDNKMQHGQFRTSCRSRVIHKFWKRFVLCIATARLVKFIFKSSFRAK